MCKTCLNHKTFILSNESLSEKGICCILMYSIFLPQTEVIYGDRKHNDGYFLEEQRPITKGNVEISQIDGNSLGFDKNVK